jgi:hypothetical protein
MSSNNMSSCFSSVLYCPLRWPLKCFIHSICIYFRILVSNIISISHCSCRFMATETSATSEVGTAYPSGAPDFTIGVRVFHLQLLTAPLVSSNISYFDSNIRLIYLSMNLLMTYRKYRKTFICLLTNMGD